MPTEFCILTPKGRGAIAAIEVRGIAAGELLQSCFRSVSGKPLASFKHNSIVYGNWIVDGLAGEDLVICPLTEDRFEIHCHGGNAAVQAIVESLFEKGAVAIASASRRDEICEIDQALSNAPTRRTALRLLAQKKAHRNFNSKLAEFIAAKDSKAAIELLESSLKYSNFGMHLTEPWLVVLCGKPNVGKSSLINAIVGFERTIVHPTPGTTRDAISHVTSIDGWPIKLTDTAGIRSSDDEIEMAGIEIARSRIANADLVVAVLDSSDPNVDDQQLVADLQPDLVVCNKIDVLGNENADGIPVSALSGKGIPELMQMMVATLVSGFPVNSQAVPVSQNQQEMFRKLLNALKNNDLQTASSLI